MYAFVAFVTFLPFLRGVLTGRSFYFRDLSQHFLPLRRFALEGLRLGELRYWNPYVHEGIPTPFPPVSYPLDLLQLLKPDEAGLSAVLALHVPLAALAFLALARGLGASRVAAGGGALVYALGGFTVSSLNFYVYLHAIAWAPLLVLTLRRAAAGASRDVAVAAACVAVAVSTIGAEIVAQAMVIALALAPWSAPRAWQRVAASLLLGLALAAPTIVSMLAVAAASDRGTGFPASVVLAHSVHPLTLAQVVVGDWYGDLWQLTDRWWGVNFFPRGFPYVLSLYLGVTALAIAAAGATGGHPLRRRLVLLAVVALVLSMGRWVGLEPLVEAFDGLRRFRFPTKLFFTVQMAVALLVTLGLDEIRAAPRAACGRIAAVGGVTGGLLLLLPLLPLLAPRRLAWFLDGFLPSGTTPALQAQIGEHIAGDAARGGAIALLAALIALAARAGRVQPRLAAVLLGGLVGADLLRTGSALNPMVTSAFWQPSPEAARLLPSLVDGTRAYTCDVQRSPAYWRARAARAGDHELWTFATCADTATPNTNLAHRLPTALSEDMTSLVPRAAVPPEDASCARLDQLLPRLRAAGVGHVISVDPLAHPEVHPIAAISPARLRPLSVFVYRLDGALARVTSVPDGAASWRIVGDRPGALDLDVQAQSPARLLIREGAPRGWTAVVAGQAAPIEPDAAGRHLVVAIPAGSSRVGLRYAPPHLGAAVAIAGLALFIAAVVGFRPRRAGPAPAAALP